MRFKISGYEESGPLVRAKVQQPPRHSNPTAGPVGSGDTWNIRATVIYRSSSNISTTSKLPLKIVKLAQKTNRCVGKWGMKTIVIAANDCFFW